MRRGDGAALIGFGSVGFEIMSGRKNNQSTLLPFALSAFLRDSVPDGLQGLSIVWPRSSGGSCPS